MDKMCNLLTATERVDDKNSYTSMLKKMFAKYKTLFMLSIFVVLMSVALQNYTINLFVRGILKLTIMQVSLR